ncbi:MAG: hypothetical protein JST53_14615 [Actinobacteria bacterium]|nr:hypothetical protein [Actinomycetota bacterium]
MKRLKLGRPSPAMVVALVALVLSLAGSAFAAVKIGTKSLQNAAVTTKKLKNRAVTAAKLAEGSVSTGKLAEGSVSSGKLTEGAVTTGKLAEAAVSAQKLAPGERSEGFVTSQLGQIALGAGASTTIASLNLPAGGSYVISASADLGNDAATPNLLGCQLRENGTVIAGGSANLAPLAVFSQETALTGASGGGTVTLACEAEKGAQARSRVMTAVRVGSLSRQ